MRHRSVNFAQVKTLGYFQISVLNDVRLFCLIKLECSRWFWLIAWASWLTCLNRKIQNIGWLWFIKYKQMYTFKKLLINMILEKHLYKPLKPLVSNISYLVGIHEFIVNFSTWKEYQLNLVAFFFFVCSPCCEICHTLLYRPSQENKQTV